MQSNKLQDEEDNISRKVNINMEIGRGREREGKREGKRERLRERSGQSGHCRGQDDANSYYVMKR